MEVNLCQEDFGDVVDFVAALVAVFLVLVVAVVSAVALAECLVFGSGIACEVSLPNVD